MDWTRAAAPVRGAARVLAWVGGATLGVLGAFVLLFVAGLAAGLGPRAAAVGAYFAVFLASAALARATVAGGFRAIS